MIVSENLDLSSSLVNVILNRKKVKFLGHVISKDGVRPDPDKVSATKEYPVPSSVKDVRAFLGLANYYRKFVKDFAKIAGPLHDLTKKGLKFQWSDAYQSAFETLKEALTHNPGQNYLRKCFH